MEAPLGGAERNTGARPRVSPPLCETMVEESIAGAYIMVGGRIGYANLKFAEQLGYRSPKEFSRGQEFACFVPANERALLREYLSALTREPGRSRRLTITALRRDGSRSRLELKTCVPQAEHPEIACGSCMEIGEREDRAVGEARAREQARRELRLRDQFLAQATHELKTPMTCLHSLLELLRDPARKHPRTLIEKAFEQSERMLKLADRLLDLSQVGAREPLLRREAADLAEIARESLDCLGPLLAAAGCQVTLKAAHGLVGRWDRARIAEVFLNLLSNAIKYGPGAPISIGLHKQAAPDGNTSARCIFRDHGPGIAPENLGRIFDPFERAAHSHDRLGHGLGLYIVRQILEAHGGRIEVRSKPGDGTEFSFLLPLEQVRD